MHNKDNTFENDQAYQKYQNPFGSCINQRHLSACIAPQARFFCYDEEKILTSKEHYYEIWQKSSQ